jgi:hypothetical protein
MHKSLVLNWKWVTPNYSNIYSVTKTKVSSKLLCYYTKCYVFIQNSQFDRLGQKLGFG